MTALPLERLRSVLAKYREDQARDSRGRFADEGGGRDPNANESLVTPAIPVTGLRKRPTGWDLPKYEGTVKTGKPVLLYRGVGDLKELAEAAQQHGAWRSEGGFAVESWEGVLQLGGNPHEIAEVDRGTWHAGQYGAAGYGTVFQVDVQGLKVWLNDPPLEPPVKGTARFPSGEANGLGVGMKDPLPFDRITRAWEVVEGRLGRELPVKPLLSGLGITHKRDTDGTQPRDEKGRWSDTGGASSEGSSLPWTGEIEDDAGLISQPSQLQELVDEYNKRRGWKHASVVRLGTAKIPVALADEEWIVAPDPAGGYRAQRPDQWLDTVDWEPFYPGWEERETKNIWERAFVYHATRTSNAEDIERLGLLAEHRSRGMGNKHVGDAVFAHPERDFWIDPYIRDRYTVFRIDMRAMKREGFAIRAEREPSALEAEYRTALGHQMGIEYSPPEFNGEDPETVIFFGNIPPRFLKRVSL